MTRDLGVLDRRPTPGAPREYRFPRFTRTTLDNGLRVIQAHVPGRPLLQAQLVVRGEAGGGAVSEAADLAGATALMARAMPEGTARRDAVALVEAAERLGADMGADAGWDSLAAHVEVPRSRLGAALALLAEMALEPSFPEREVERLRDERLNDLRQAMADPRRRAERAFLETIFAPGAAYGRPLGGTEATVPGLERDTLATRHARLMRPEACTLIVCGDLDGVPVEEAVQAAFGAWAASGAAEAVPEPVGAAQPAARSILIVDRPGAPQSEVRIGHVGVPRRTPDFHAVSVTNSILGGLFNSRLNRLLREERGYTYGVHSGFDMRRDAGPFAVRCAVESAVTVPAVTDIMAELRRVREAPVAADELGMAVDYLVGVFPLRFESSAQVAGAIGGLVVFELPDDELDSYRPRIATVSAEDVLVAAREHIDPEGASIVIVGDAARFEEQLRHAGLGDVRVVRDEAVTEGAPAGAQEPDEGAGAEAAR